MQTLSIKEAADELGVHTNTIRNWIRDGRIDTTRLGPRFIRIDRAELSKLVTKGN